MFSNIFLSSSGRSLNFVVFVKGAFGTFVLVQYNSAKLNLISLIWDEPKSKQTLDLTNTSKYKSRLTVVLGSAVQTCSRHLRRNRPKLAVFADPPSYSFQIRLKLTAPRECYLIQNLRRRKFRRDWIGSAAVAAQLCCRKDPGRAD